MPNDEKLSTTIINTLRKRVLHWEYPPAHLLTEKVLCQEFDVSRSPVREALRVLEMTGLVQKKDTQGYVVKQIGPTEVQELYDLRLAIELFSVEAVTVAKEKHEAIQALRSEWVESDLKTKTNLELAKIDQQFHESITALTDNTALLKVLQKVNERLFIFRMIDFEQTERLKTTCLQHMDILDAILSGDIAYARQCLRKNVDFARDYVDIAIKDMLIRSFEM